MNQQFKVLEYSKNCTLFDNQNSKSANIENSIFFNAVLGRISQGFTQNDVCCLLKISKRSVVKFEKGLIDKPLLISKYIESYEFDFANNKKELIQIRFRNKH